MQRKITKQLVDKLVSGERDVIAWDSEVKGFGVRCRPSGAKYYVVKMRVGGRQRWLTIGRHGSPWTPDAARGEALRLLGLKAGGEDPAAKRDHSKGVITIEALADRFLADHVAHRCKPTTASDHRRAVEQSIIPVLGKHRVTDISRADIGQLHHELRRHPSQANRVLAVLSRMMSLAEEWGLRDSGSNPCRHVKKYAETKRERYLSRDELRRLGDVLATAEPDETPFVIAAIRLLVLTGARLSEILTLKWDYVDLATGTLRLPDSKTGAKTILLNPPTIELLSAMPRVEGNPYVIVGEKPGAHLVNLQKPWRRIRAQAEIDNVRIHDLRHSFASVAAAAGLSLPIIGKMLGHSQPATTARYAHLANDPVREASARVGRDIMADFDPTTPRIRLAKG